MRAIILLVVLVGCGVPEALPLAVPDDGGTDALVSVDDAATDGALPEDSAVDLGADAFAEVDAGAADASVDVPDDGVDAGSLAEDAGDPDLGADAGEEPDAFVGVDAGPVCGDCDDGDPCTIDRCLDTGCDHYAVSTLLSGVDYEDAYARNPSEAPLPLTGYQICIYSGDPASPYITTCVDLTTTVAPHTAYLRIWQGSAIVPIQFWIRTPSLVMCDYVDRLRTNRSPGVHTSAVSLGLWTGDDLQAGATAGEGHDYCATTLEANTSIQWTHCNLCEPRWTSCP